MSLGRLAPTSFRGRIVFSTVALVVVVMLVAGVALQILLGFTARRDIESRLEERSAAAIAIIDGASSRSLTVSPDTLEPGVRVYDDRGHLVGGSMDEDLHDRADDLSRTSTARTVGGNEDFQLRATPFTTPSGDSAVLVVSQETTPYERSEFYALLVTLFLGVVVVGIVAAIARRVTTQALRPVTQMAKSASEWSEHDLTHRFALGPADDELAALGETLDQLLDRVASVIRSEQRLTSELAHELRTPLTAIQGSADLALIRGIDDGSTRADVEQIAASARVMARVISTLLDLAREAGNRSLLTSHARDVVEPARAMVPERLRLIDNTSMSTARIAAPHDLVMRALAPIVDNAVRHARTTITVTADDAPDTVSISVGNDGPAVAEETRRALFEPGTSPSGSTGLGLAISRRVARSLGGDAVVGDRTDGAEFTLRLPRS